MQKAKQQRQRPAGCPFPPRSLPASFPCFYGVVIILLMACVKVHRSFGVSSIYAFSVPTMMADSGLPSAQFSSVYGAGTLAGAVFQFRWGRLIDRCKQPIFAGIFMGPILSRLLVVDGYILTDAAVMPDGARLALPGFLCMLGFGLGGMTFCGPELGWLNLPLLFVCWTCMRTTAIGALDNCTNTVVVQQVTHALYPPLPAWPNRIGCGVVWLLKL